jgi:nucleoside-specific outer membrane channel protein Tsx
MFKKGDKVVHSAYGTGEIWKVNPNHVVKHKDKNNIQISHRGTIEIAFDSEMGEDDGNGKQKTHTMLSDGREVPIGAGYFWNGIFNEYGSSVQLFKIN